MRDHLPAMTANTRTAVRKEKILRVKGLGAACVADPSTAVVACSCTDHKSGLDSHVILWPNSSSVPKTLSKGSWLTKPAANQASVLRPVQDRSACSDQLRSSIPRGYKDASDSVMAAKSATSELQPLLRHAKAKANVKATEIHSGWKQWICVPSCESSRCNHLKLDHHPVPGRGNL